MSYYGALRVKFVRTLVVSFNALTITKLCVALVPCIWRFIFLSFFMLA